MTTEIELSIWVDGRRVAHSVDMLGTARKSVAGVAECFHWNAEQLFENNPKLLEVVSE